MHRFWEIVKAHPWAIAIAVIVTIIVFWWWGRSGGSSGGGSVVVPGPTDAQLQAQTAEDINAQNNSAANALAKTQADAAVQVATLAAGSQNQSTSAMETVYNNLINAQASVAGQAISAQQDVTNKQTAGALTLAGISAETQKSLATIAATMNANNNQTNLQSQGLATLSNLTQIGFNANLAAASSYYASGQTGSYQIANQTANAQSLLSKILAQLGIGNKTAA